MNESVLWVRWDLLGLARGELLACGCRAGVGGWGEPGDQVCVTCSRCEDCCVCVDGLIGLAAASARPVKGQGAATG